MGKSLSKEEVDLIVRNTKYEEAEVRLNYKTFLERFPEGRVDKDQFEDVFTRQIPDDCSAVSLPFLPGLQGAFRLSLGTDWGVQVS